MLNLSEIKRVYFIGIGGIGMSAIARYFFALGMKVSGYDKTSTDLTDKLISEGIQIHFNDDISAIPNEIDLVVYTPAIPQTHLGINHLKASGIPMMKRSEVLGLISSAKTCVAIAGTHGKTTTSTMVAHLLQQGGKDISAFLGGIATDYGTNCLIGQSDIVVLEADEFDRSFLFLQPDIAAILSMDADHLDIYGDNVEMISGYKEFASRVKDVGKLILKKGLIDHFTSEEIESLVSRNIQIMEFGDDHCDINIEKVHVKNGKFVFDYQDSEVRLQEVFLNLPGKHNVENASVAIAIALLIGVSEDRIRYALSEFKGIHRRFEKIVEDGKIVYIDDYAHHPSELKAAIQAARTLYPDKKLTGIFQPHLYSRTRDFVDGFAAELDKLDEVILMDIYPARELPIEGVDSGIIFQRLKNKNKKWVKKQELMDNIEWSQLEVLLTLGAGDIDTFVEKIKTKLVNIN